MANTYEAERKSAKTDITADGCPAKVLNRQTDVETPCAVLILTFTAFERLGGAVSDDTAKFMLHALDVPDIDVELHDIVIDTADAKYALAVGTYQILNPNPFMIGGIPIYYDLEVRKR